MDCPPIEADYSEIHFRLVRQHALGTYLAEPIEGIRISLADGVDGILHEQGKGYRVTEFITGCWLADGVTEAEAVDTALDGVAKFGALQLRQYIGGLRFMGLCALELANRGNER